MTLSTQFVSMLTMVFAGGLSAACFDTYKQLGRPSIYWKQYFIDLLFFVTQACIVYFLLYLANGGVLRFYLFIALILGISTYYALFQQQYLKFLDRMVVVLIRIYYLLKKLLENLVLRPLVWLSILLFSIIVAIGRFLLRTIVALGKVVVTIILFFIPRIVKKPLISWFETCHNKINKGLKSLTSFVKKRWQKDEQKKESSKE
ncbi:spore cortex biosynthesis protein YabQ [Alkalibacillus aidingensis]|uniref:spore cortex biosynthesis protein YabQ n=1 Tax=Alkalibacillus aidingensis TaxID=2747607 RepID=UPI0016607E5C|nr:spore cortex biosynthesis protein YabQ [Alkalibacillus aidingensis]